MMRSFQLLTPSEFVIKHRLSPFWIKSTFAGSNPTPWMHLKRKENPIRIVMNIRAQDRS